MARVHALKSEIDDLNRRFRAARLHGVTAQATRHGKLVVYYRKALGHPKVRLKAEPLSPAFVSEWADLREGRIAPSAVRRAPASSPLPLPHSATGTLRAMIESYYESTDYLAKKPRTRHVERLVLDGISQEPIAPGDAVRFGDLPFGDIKTKAVRILQRRKVSKKTICATDEDTGEQRELEVLIGTEAGNARVKYLRSVFEYAKSEDAAEINYATEVGYLKPANPHGHATWTEQDIAAYEAKFPIGTKERLALALLLYGGPRRGDVVRLGPGMLKTMDGREFLVYIQEKNRDGNPVRAYIPVVPALRAVLNATPTQGLYFLSWGEGRPYSKESFGNLFRDSCRAAGLPKGRSMHGMRKACVVRMIRDDCSPFEIMSVTGHRTMKEIERYGRDFGRSQAAKEVFENWVRKHGPAAQADEVRLSSLNKPRSKPV
jgi:integrase